MKKFLLYALCLQLIAVAGCNNNDKVKEAGSDSAKKTMEPDTALEQMKAYLALPVPGFNPDSTIQNLNKYPDLSDKTQIVKFSYSRFSLFIDSLDKKFNAQAKGIYLIYGAYTPAAVNWYLQNHKTLTHGDSLSILNKPCLVIAYKDPTNGQFFYAADIGTICPPPNSCESFASYSSPFTIASQAGFDPGPTIANYDAQFQTGKNPIHPLTQRVKFDIAAVRYLADSLNGVGVSTTDIYFALGAYTSADAQRYITTHPAKPPITADEIKDRTCLLLAYKNPGPKIVAQFTYYDLGTICPPPNSCETAFYYKK